MYKWENGQILLEISTCKKTVACSKTQVETYTNFILGLDWKTKILVVFLRQGMAKYRWMMNKKQALEINWLIDTKSIELIGNLEDRREPKYEPTKRNLVEAVWWIWMDSFGVFSFKTALQTLEVQKYYNHLKTIY